MSPELSKFFAQTKIKCDATAKKLATLELSIHDNKEHQQELKTYFNFTDKKLAARKKELIKASK